ncbi:MAG TPA: hypothetical protein VFZ65_15840 [Planctomycetota bacterium]|nr:hypothetical protein [Planctomycetota bacterium]
MNPSRVAWSLLFVAAACAAPGPEAPGPVRMWGTLREVLREGHSEARVALAGVARADTVGVGALAGLAGEVTVLDGHVLVACASGAAAGVAPERCAVRDAGPGDAAALLVLADVPAWQEFALGACESYEALERAIAEHLRQRGHDLAEPIALRVRGRATHLALHVIAGACPIAHPEGPPPWRHDGAAEAVQLVGFFVEGSAGTLTHHMHRSHLHAVAGDVMGHLDEVALAEATLLLPAS